LIKFEPFPIVISGNHRDDLLYQLWKLGGSKPSEKPHNLDEIELRPGFGKKSDDYEQQVFDCLLKIGRYKTGRQVLAESFKLKKDFYILPLGERDKAIRMDSIWLDNKPGANAYTRTANALLHTTRVLFTPYHSCKCNDPLGTSEPDVTLLHELVHAVRPDMVNKQLPRATGDAWNNHEEFFAVTVENMYRAERGIKCLRGGHDASMLGAERATSAGFLEDKSVKARVQEALKRESLAQKLARFTDLPFNPFATAQAVP
jgi:hypothetical protein